MLAWGWRLPLLASAVLVIFGLWLRLGVTESPVFQELQRTATAARTRRRRGGVVVDQRVHHTRIAARDGKTDTTDVFAGGQPGQARPGLSPIGALVGTAAWTVWCVTPGLARPVPHRGVQHVGHAQAAQVVGDQAQAPVGLRHVQPVVAGGHRVVEVGHVAPALQDLAAAHGEHIEAVDLNPVVVLPTGARVVDALVLARAT